MSMPAHSGLHSLCVFTGSKFGAKDCYRATATALGRAMALRGVALVYGGAHCGLMGALADVGEIEQRRARLLHQAVHDLNSDVLGVSMAATQLSRSGLVRSASNEISAVVVMDANYNFEGRSRRTNKCVQLV